MGKQESKHASTNGVRYRGFFPHCRYAYITYIYIYPYLLVDLA